MPMRGQDHFAGGSSSGSRQSQLMSHVEPGGPSQLMSHVEPEDSS
jgi:hypothetical protein